MKITRIQNIPIEIPYRERVRSHLAHGWQSQQDPTINTHIYIVETDEGLTGYGEGPNLGDQTESYIGHSPFEYLLDDRTGACQIAFYDLMAKYTDQPVYRLFGPLVKDRVSIAYWSHCFAPDSLAAEAKFALENGFRLHKIKSRPFENSADQVAAMAAVVAPDYRIMVDANGTWKQPTEALRIARSMQAYPNIYLFITLAFLAEDDMIVEPMTVEDGTMAVPQTAGLGVTLDMDALEKYRLA
jgi:L-alanine-DL-glutamate epimerase-like enolase superfamily enzyme